MPVSRNQPSPQRQSVLSFVSPKVADLLFFETVDAQKIGNTPKEIEANLPVYGTAHPDTANFPNHKLCFIKQADPNGLMYQYYYAADRSSQDDYNFEFSQADIGGNKYDTVVRTYVTLRSGFSDVDASHKAGEAMPDPTNQFAAENIVEYHDGAGSTTDEELVSTDYILMTRQQKRIGDQELDSLFVVEQRVYFRRVDIVSQSLDPATGGILKTVVKLVHRGENFTTPAGAREAGTTAYEAEANWGLSTAGQNFETQQLSHDWWQVTIQDVIPQTGLSDLYSGKVIREYDTWQNFTWPSVVDSLHFNTANRKDGASQTTVTVRMKEGKDGFSGPTKMTVKQVWKKTKFTGSDLPNATIFKTVSAKYSGVQYNVSVSNVLTEAITLIDFIGTEHPTYKMGDYAFPKPWCRASSPTDWDVNGDGSAFNGSVTQKPFRGGYLLEVVLVHLPS